MGYYAAFVHGSKVKTLNTTDDIMLSPEFQPPALNVQANIAGGTLGNRRSGGKVVGRKHGDRPLSLPLYAKGSSVAETHGNVRQLESFVERCLNDTSEVLYFVFGASDAIPYTPKWGQNFVKYEVKHADGAFVSRNIYAIADVRGAFVPWSVPLLVGPFGTGERQRVGSATGGILEDSNATPDGLSRGLIIPPAARNYVLNPIFGHATFDTDWTEGSGIDAYENTDKSFIYAGEKSAKIIAHGASGRYYRTSVDLPAEVCLFSCWVKKTDQSAVTADDVVLVYDSGGLTETYTALGDGWYRVYARGTGTGAAANFDINFGENFAGCIDGVQVEATNYPTPLIYGDLLDCEWDGTAHTDESTRTAARYYIHDPVDIGQGTIVCTWKASTAESLYDGNVRIFVTEDSNFDCYYNVTSNEFAFTDGTNTVAVSATMADGDKFIIIASWGRDGIALHVNGTTDTDASYDMPTAEPDFLYLGRTAGAAGYSVGTFMGLTIYDVQLTTTEATAHHTNLTEYINSGDGLGQCVNPIPWLWTDDGDDVLDSYYIASTHEDFCVLGGIPGNTFAETLFSLENSDQGYGLAISNFLSDFYINMGTLFHNCIGHADGSAVGGQVRQVTVGTTATAADVSTLPSSSTDAIVNALLNNKFTMFISLSDAGSGLRLRPRFTFGGVNVEYDWQALAADGTRKNFFSFTYPTTSPLSANIDWFSAPSINFVPYLKRDSGSATVEIDYFRIMPSEWLYIEPSTNFTDEFIIKGLDVRGMFNDGYYEKIPVEGDIVELHPNKYNHLIAIPGDQDSNTDITRTTTINRIYVTPRWSLL